MRRIIEIAAAGVFIGLAAVALAASPRTFVSGSGSDSAPCTLLKPCRTFDRAISQADPGGEVVALDSAGYGSFTVNKAITVEAAPGVYAGITVTGTVATIAIDVAAGSSDAVTLRGLTINSLNPNAVGMRFLSGATLHIENCIVNSADVGVWSVGTGTLNVKDSIFRGNLFGIRIEPVSGTNLATVQNVRLVDNGDGLDAVDGANVTVQNSVASGNKNLGFGVTSFTSRAVELNLENCVSSGNAHFGIAVGSFASAPAIVRLSNCTITRNNLIGLSIGGSPAALLSRGNNTVEGNGTDVSGTIGSYSPK